MNLKKTALLVLGLAPLVAAVAPAYADTFVYNWTLTGPDASLGGVPQPGSGTLTATTGTTGDTVIDITGTLGGSAITGLTSFFGSDNVVFPEGTSFLSTKGLAFTTASGESVNIFAFNGQGTPPSGNAYGEEISGGSFGVGTFNLTPVPLPASWTMLLIGAGALGAFAFRRGKGDSSRDVAGFAAA
jgi:hypothetical protein